MVLLITGSIDLSGFTIPNTKLTETKERLSQYVDSIEYAIENYERITQLVFCENTNYLYDYSELKEKARIKGKMLETLTFQGRYEEIQLKGKGYGEGEIIEYALKNSLVLKNNNFFYKMTGRIKILNMNRILKLTEAENAFDYHPGKIYDREKGHLETIFFKTGKDLYMKYLMDAYQEVDEHRYQYLEHIFYEQLKGLKMRSFPIRPQISGFSGTTGKLYNKRFSEALLEKIYYRAGVHHLHKRLHEKIIYGICLLMLKTWRKLKKVICL